MTAGVGTRIVTDNKGGVITAIDGHVITDTSDLSGLLESHKLGDRITLTWKRGRGNPKVSKLVTLSQDSQGGGTGNGKAPLAREDRSSQPDRT